MQFQPEHPTDSFYSIFLQKDLEKKKQYLGIQGEKTAAVGQLTLKSVKNAKLMKLRWDVVVQISRKEQASEYLQE